MRSSWPCSTIVAVRRRHCSAVAQHRAHQHAAPWRCRPARNQAARHCSLPCFDHHAAPRSPPGPWRTYPAAEKPGIPAAAGRPRAAVRKLRIDRHGQAQHVPACVNSLLGVLRIAHARDRMQAADSSRRPVRQHKRLASSALVAVIRRSASSILACLSTSIEAQLPYTAITSNRSMLDSNTLLLESISVTSVSFRRKLARKGQTHLAVAGYDYLHPYRTSLKYFTPRSMRINVIISYCASTCKQIVSARYLQYACISTV